MSADVVYLDSSAIVKIVIREPESAALRAHLKGRRHIASCALARVEVIRAIRPHGSEAVMRAREVLGATRLLNIDNELLNAATTIEPHTMRSLDAIHCSAARSFDTNLQALITYDMRMAYAARHNGIAVVMPGRDASN